MKRWFIPMALLAVALIVVGCGGTKDNAADNKPATPAENAPTGGNPVQPPPGG